MRDTTWIQSFNLISLYIIQCFTRILFFYVVIFKFNEKQSLQRKSLHQTNLVSENQFKVKVVQFYMGQGI